MLQPQFVGGLLKMCKERGIHTAVDTCGYFSTENLKLVLPYTDLMLFDLKHMDPQKHRAYTSQENSLILKNLKEIVQSGIQIFIRIPIIPGYNDSKENLIETAKYHCLWICCRIIDSEKENTKCLISLINYMVCKHRQKKRWKSIRVFSRKWV